MRIYRIAKKSHLEVLKDNKVPLTDEERQICLDRKAVWHHGPNGEESPAVWKSKGSDGKITYVTNTHRAFQDADTLEGAIKKFHDFIKSTASESVRMQKEAVSEAGFMDLKDRVRDLKSDIGGIKKDHKDFESRIKKLEKIVEELNIGQRMFTQNKTVFTSLERKLERAEAVVQEWRQYKKEMDENIKKQVEKHTKARISDVTPQSY